MNEVIAEMTRDGAGLDDRGHSWEPTRAPKYDEDAQELLEACDRLLSEGAYELARSMLVAAEREFPENPFICIRLARLASCAGDDARALLYSRTAAKAAPDNSPLIATHSEILRKAGNFVEGLAAVADYYFRTGELLECAFRAAVDDVLVVSLTAEETEAVRDFISRLGPKLAVDGGEHAPILAAAAGALAHKIGETGAELGSLAHWNVAYDAKSPAETLAWIVARTGTPISLQQADALVAALPSSGPLLQGAAHSLRTTGAAQVAERIVSKLVEVGCAVEDTYYDLATMTATANPNRMKEILDQGLTKFPQSPLLRIEQAKFLARSGDLGAALANAETAFNEMPQSLGIGLEYLNLLYEAGRYDALLKVAAVVLKHHPGCEAAHVLASRSADATGDTAAALEHARAAYEQRPSDPDLKLLLEAAEAAVRPKLRAVKVEGSNGVARPESRKASATDRTSAQGVIVERFDQPSSEPQSEGDAHRSVKGVLYRGGSKLRFFNDVKSVRRVAIVASYGRSNKLLDYHKSLIADLGRMHYVVVQAHSEGGLSLTDTADSVDHLSCLIRRNNVGYDFGSWTTAVNLLAEQWDAIDELLLVNDSNFGKAVAALPVLSRLDGQFVCLTDSFEQSYHGQSYFLLFRREALQSKAILDFFSNYGFPNFKDEVVKQGELALTRRVMQEGFAVRPLAPYERLAERWLDELPDTISLVQEQYRPLGPLGKRRLEERLERFSQVAEHILSSVPMNPSHFFWRTLIKDFSHPFVKRELLMKNPVRVPDLVLVSTSNDARRLLCHAEIAQYARCEGGCPLVELGKSERQESRVGPMPETAVSAA